MERKALPQKTVLKEEENYKILFVETELPNMAGHLGPRSSRKKSINVFFIDRDHGSYRVGHATIYILSRDVWQTV